MAATHFTPDAVDSQSGLSRLYRTDRSHDKTENRGHTSEPKQDVLPMVGLCVSVGLVKLLPSYLIPVSRCVLCTRMAFIQKIGLNETTGLRIWPKNYVQNLSRQTEDALR